MQMILIHIKANPFVKYGQLFPEYVTNLVAHSEYYYCHWILHTTEPYHILVFSWTLKFSDIKYIHIQVKIMYQTKKCTAPVILSGVWEYVAGLVYTYMYQVYDIGYTMVHPHKCITLVAPRLNQEYLKKTLEQMPIAVII